MGEWQRQVGEGQLALAGHDEILAMHDHQGFQHTRIKHVPGTYLLFDHREAGLVKIHRHGNKGSVGRRADNCKPAAPPS